MRIGFGGPSGQQEFRTLLTTDGLIRNTPDGRYEARLAESYTVEDGGNVLALRLRQSVTFHDGVALTAEVVKDFLDTSRAQPFIRQQYPTLTDIRAIEVTGPHSLRLHLDRSSSLLLLGDLAIGVYREVDGERVGTGAFILESESQGEMTFVSNPTYYRGRPTVDVIHWVAHPTVRTAWAAMMRGEVDYLYDVPIGAREFVEAGSSFELRTVDRPYTYVVGFNHEHHALGRTQVRQALNYAVDRRVVVERGLRGYGRVGSGVWPAHWVYGGVERTYRYDPALADRLLTEAGYPLPPARGATGAAMVSRLRFTCLVMEGAIPEEIALLVQRQLYEVGVDMQLQAVPAPELVPRMLAGDYDTVLLPMNLGRTLARLHNFWHSDSEQSGVWRSATRRPTPCSTISGTRRHRMTCRGRRPRSSRSCSRIPRPSF